ncbi:ImmA/IrrE family metallo-endopeptidase [Bradyrhizobium japonicum]|uniref:ImmA/IrrE family metallo-endopeptidase n=1 Tax=Bradyrhizobium japonicum TaxID=375 RepID=UPI00200BE6E0|nr:ImmA/IrrE family metallo-endopeptidase [Bradyrhizobium japonicum]UQD95221.1 ImmA/IrrE family metallo-endopeptidase [Bradyrhizobium japonicum]
MSNVPNSAGKAAGLAELRAELQEAGIDWGAVSKVLPDWAETAYESKAGRLELRGFVQRHLGLTKGDGGRLSQLKLPAARFKTRSNTSPDQVASARAAATACARVVAGAINTEWVGLSSKPDELRELIRGRSKHGWVDLEALLEFTWASGIPVLFLPDLPSTGHKMEGMVTFAKGRPVVVLTKKASECDWMLFILAHELGHVALKHLEETEGQAIVDDTVEDSDSNDAQEKEANGFATKLLSSQGKLKIGAAVPKAPALAAMALDFGQKHGISPGHVILNVVRHTTIPGFNLFPLGNAALKCLPENIRGQSPAELCRQAAGKHLDLEKLKNDSVEYLQKLGVI